MFILLFLLLLNINYMQLNIKPDVIVKDCNYPGVF